METNESFLFEESAGLRHTLLAYLPKEVGDALSVVTSYIYDQALAEGPPPGEEGYVEREVAALLADLSYVEARLVSLAAVGKQTNLSADQVAWLGRAKAAMPHLRRAREEMAQVAPAAEESDGERRDEDG